MKKKLAVYSMLMLIAVFAFVACGGGGGGVVISGPGGTPDGTFTKYVYTGNSYGSMFGNISNDVTAENRKNQFILEAADIGGSGYITAMDFVSATDTSGVSISCPDITLRMGHTNLATLTTTLASNYETGHGSLETVIANSVVVFPAVVAGEPLTLNLETPFYFNGQDNIIVEFIKTGNCDDDINISTESTGRSSIWTNNLSATSATVNAYAPVVDLHFKGGVNEVSQTHTYLAPPLNTNPSWQRMQMLYTPGMINGSGRISGFAVKAWTTTTNQQFEYSMRLAHTGVSNLTSIFADNFDMGSGTLVADAAILNVPAGIPDGEYFWIPMPDGTFDYNGQDNLLVEIIVNSATGNVNISDYDSSYDSGAWGANDNPYVATVGAYLLNARFRFKGGTMDVMPSPTVFTTVFGVGAQTRQYMFRATELGTAGTINKLACRLNSGTTLETTFSNFEAKLETTDAEQLDGGSTSANSPNPTTVYSGDFVLPADLIAGDWIDIPFSTPYAYNGEGNLIVTLSNDGSGGNSYTCRNSASDAVRYPKQLSDQSGGGYNNKGVMRFFLK